MADGDFTYRDMAVLYRANAQSNAIERSLIKSGIPYRIIGGHRFNDTKEVRDAIAYLRVINNPDDGVSVRRIINEPKRGIGDTTLEHAAQIADEQGISLYAVLSHADEYAALSRAAGKILAFTRMMDELRDATANEDISLHLLYTQMLEKTGYKAMWQLAGEAEAERVANLEELASSIRNYEDNCEEAFPQLSGFLEENALMTDVDNYDAGADAVVLMTMHAAKGLEFPVVFLPGFEEGIFPAMQTMFMPEEVEEDRRLCYVALTRAKKELYICRAQSRMLYGSTTRNRPSRFLQDIPQQLTETHDSTRGYSHGGYSYRREESAASVALPQREHSYRAPVSIGGGGITASGTATKASTEQWAVGDAVAHKAFGNGTILSVQPMGNDTLLTIEFDKAGVKKVMATFAKLIRL